MRFEFSRRPPRPFLTRPLLARPPARAQFNTPVQLGPASSTRPHDARIFTVPVQADDILILASDGLSDNLWDADTLDEVVRFRRSFMGAPAAAAKDGEEAPATSAPTPTPAAPSATFRRSTLAGMLSEALCSRAKRVSETRGARRHQAAVEKKGAAGAQAEVDVPFARRAREQGKLFEGGKPDGAFVCLYPFVSRVADYPRCYRHLHDHLLS